jgi:hypothetical protein
VVYDNLTTSKDRARRGPTSLLSAREVDLLIERPLLKNEKMEHARYALLRWFGSHDSLRMGK